MSCKKSAWNRQQAELLATWDIQSDSKFLSRFPWTIIFNTRNNKIKLLTEYESVIQKVSLPVELILKNAKQLQHVRLYFVVSGLKITGHGNPDNNLESRCITLCSPVGQPTFRRSHSPCAYIMLVYCLAQEQMTGARGRTAGNFMITEKPQLCNVDPVQEGANWLVS
jgi:hypothetical protein